LARGHLPRRARQPRRLRLQVPRRQAPQDAGGGAARGQDGRLELQELPHARAAGGPEPLGRFGHEALPERPAQLQPQGPEHVRVGAPVRRGAAQAPPAQRAWRALRAKRLSQGALRRAARLRLRPPCCSSFLCPQPPPLVPKLLLTPPPPIASAPLRSAPLRSALPDFPTPRLPGPRFGTHGNGRTPRRPARSSPSTTAGSTTWRPSCTWGASRRPPRARGSSSATSSRATAPPSSSGARRARARAPRRAGCGSRRRPT
jgi:hypothetical protein